MFVSFQFQSEHVRILYGANTGVNEALTEFFFLFFSAFFLMCYIYGEENNRIIQEK